MYFEVVRFLIYNFDEEDSGSRSEAVLEITTLFSTNQSVILIMLPNPKPHQIITFFNCQGTVAKPYPRRLIITHLFEMQRRVLR
jgi:hypothetical protein